MTLMTLLARLGMDTSDYHGKMQGAERQTHKSAGNIIKSLSSIGKKAALGGLTLAAGAVAGLAFALVRSVGAAALEREGIAELGASVAATGADWDTASTAIERYIASSLLRTALDDGEGRIAISRLTQATGQYTSALGLMNLTQDWARAKKMDLASAAEFVGKVAQGNTSIVQRYGIVLREGATASEALAEMQKRVAGQGEAYAQSLKGQTSILSTSLGNISETVGGLFEKGLTKLIGGANKMLAIVQTALDKVGPLFSTEFEGIADAMLGSGENVGASFAQGLANAIPYLLATLRIIGNIIKFWLEPGSPPKLLPDLDKWGTSAMDAWFKGWTKGDFGILKSMTGTLQSVLSGMVSEGLLAEGQANPLLRALRAQIAGALDELKATGGISESTFAAIRAAGGPAGAQAEAYARKALGVEQARLKVKGLEEKLAGATTAEEVTALAQQLDAARAEQKAAEEALSLEEERLQALTDEASLMERQAGLMERVAKDMEKAAKAASDLANFLAGVQMPEGLPEGESPFAKMFDTKEIQRKVDEIVNKIMPKLVSPDGKSGVFQKLKRFLEGDFKYAIKGVFAGLLVAIGVWGVGALVAMGPAGWIILGIIAGVALLAKAWDEDWRGMRTSLTEAWEKIKPILDGIIAKIREAIETFEEWVVAQGQAIGVSGPAGVGDTSGGVVNPLPGVPSGPEPPAPTPPPYHFPLAAGLEPTWFRRATSLLVGEGGEPELVSVTPRSKMRRPRGGVSQVNNFYVNSLNEQRLAQAQREQRLGRVAIGAGF